MSNTIRQQFFYSHPPAAVWEFLTNADLMSLWLMPNDFQPVLGQEFQFRMKPIPALNLDGIIYCKVLEIDPPKKLTYSWKCGPGDGVMLLDSLVVWTLVEKDNGTELDLVHSGFKEIENLALYNGMTSGWLEKLQKIAEQLKTPAHGAANA